MDVDRIMRDYDVNSLQDSIMGITFCDIEREIDTRMVDQNFVTVFKLAQLIIQYLLVSYYLLPSLKTLFNIVEAPLNKLLNFDVCVV